MDIRDLSPEMLRGNIIGILEAMHGGKTETVVSELMRGEHAGFNVIGYNHPANCRDGKALVVDGRIEFPGKIFGTIGEIRRDLEKRLSSMGYSKPGSNGDQNIVVDGIRHKKGVPLLSFGIDEINLYTLNEKDAQEVTEFFQWTKQQGLVGYVSGLEFDFRQMPFGNVQSIIPYIDIRLHKRPVCKAANEGRQCSKPALHSQRLWRMDLVQEEQLERLLSDAGKFDFALKGGQVVSGQYVPAPFFDKTVRIEGPAAEDLHQIEYIPVCSNCSRLPYKEEVFKIYEAVINGKEVNDANPDERLRTKIIQFLVDEKWVRNTGKEGGLKYEAIPSFRNRLGGYTPH